MIILKCIVNTNLFTVETKYLGNKNMKKTIQVGTYFIIHLDTVCRCIKK